VLPAVTLWLLAVVVAFPLGRPAGAAFLLIAYAVVLLLAAVLQSR
jgi:hypothetical protein